MDRDDHNSTLSRKNKTVHEIGQDVSLLSIQEIDERLALLHEEVLRLDKEKIKKDSARLHADTLFNI